MEKLTIRMTGSEFSAADGYNLGYVADTLTNVQALFDKTYGYLNGDTRVTPEQRNNLKLKITDFREGSLITDISVDVWTTVLPVASTLAQLNAAEVVELVTKSIEFFKVVIPAKKSGKTVEYKNEKGGQSVIINGNPVFHGPVNIVNAAYATAPKISDLVSNIDGDRFSAMEFSETGKTNSVIVDQETAQLFKKSTHTGKVSITFIGTSVSSNKAKETGRVEILDGEYKGEYPFVFLDDETSHLDELKTAFNGNAKFTAVPIFEYDPVTDIQTIKRLKVQAIEKI